MRHTLIIIISIFFHSFSFGQQFTRHDNETAEMFANRLKPDSTEIDHTVIETNSLDTTKKMILSFYRKTIRKSRQMDTYVDHSEYEIILGFVYIPITGNFYERILIDTISPDGGNPEIVSVFFANADKDKTQELLILCRYEQKHYDYNGYFYGTNIYDYTKDKNRFTSLQKISEKFFGCECSFRDRKPEKAKYKTVKEVKALLSKMGFKP